METRVISFDYTEDEEQRLDRFLAAAAPEFSRARLQALIKSGLVKINGIAITKSGSLLKAGHHIVVEIPPRSPSGLVREQIPLDILFENEDVLVVNKPAGMVVHPAPGHAGNTLVNAAIGHDPAMEGVGGEERPGVVHRLDKETSGVILLAKNDRALRWLQDQFQDRAVKKTYLALVDGRPPSPSGRVEAPVGRDPAKRQKMAVMPRGKSRTAISEYRTLESFPNHTLLEFHPLTGRTHQIRLHCAFLGCPIVGDSVYGLRKPTILLGRHFLHASEIELTLPGESQPSRFTAELPDDLLQALTELRQVASRGEAEPRER